MIKMLIIADDFTGALDTGVKFAAAGAVTKVVTDSSTDFSPDDREDVLVLCAPTRHFPPQDAYRMIRAVTERAVAAGIGCIFKKTDSALRGNIGAELSAVLDGSGEPSLTFIPALPAMNRITRQGIHYIGNRPVTESVFGKDPFEPVTESYVPALLHQQCETPVHLIPAEDFSLYTPERGGIYVFDCASGADMEREVQELKRRGQLRVLAGCSGLAETLASTLGISGNRGCPETCVNRMTVVCGSINPISLHQLDYAARRGFCRVHLSEQQLLGKNSLYEAEGRALIDQLWSVYCSSELLIIDTLTEENTSGTILQETEDLSREELRQRIAQRMGGVLKALMDRGTHSRLMIIGGDTLLAFLEAIGCSELFPIREVMPGIVLSHMIYQHQQYEILSKSGGFGSENLLITLGKETESHREQVSEVAAG